LAWPPAIIDVIGQFTKGDRHGGVFAPNFKRRAEIILAPGKRKRKISPGPRQNKYLNYVIEQDHRPIKLRCRATVGFTKFRTAKITIGGFESMRIIRKRQLRAEGNTSAEIFHSMAA
jgi:hypothetical protein